MLGAENFNKVCVQQNPLWQNSLSNLIYGVYNLQKKKLTVSCTVEIGQKPIKTHSFSFALTTEVD